MSSTKRGGQREPTDYYCTPQWAILEFLDAYHQLNGPLTGPLLDPCAGGIMEPGGLVTQDMAYPKALSAFYFGEVNAVSTLDLRHDSPAHLASTNYLTFDTDVRFQTIISNPPFALAMAFITKGLSHLAQGGKLIYLLRLNFLGTQRRAAFFCDHPPSQIFVHSRRLCFTGNGKTDSVEYAHFVWDKEWTGHPAALYVLGAELHDSTQPACRVPRSLGTTPFCFT